MKAEILAALRDSGEYVSGQELCERFGVSRTAVWKEVQKLKAEGYQIEAVSNKGYRLTGAPDILSVEEIASFCKTSWAGKEIVYYDVTDSTNIQAKRLAEEGACHGTLVVAGSQESGRGRRGRSWESPANGGIFMTLLLRPEFAPEKASMLTIVAAMAVASAIRKALALPAEIKWPNDIVLNKKKICGILTELNTEIDAINYVVVGIGINVSNQKFDKDAASVATSIALESGKQVHRACLIAAVMEEFEAYYELFCRRGDLSGIRDEYDKYLANRNRQSRILDPQEPFSGVARGINDRGELLVETKEGIRAVSSGEVSVRGLYGYV